MSFIDNIISAESGGNPYARNPRSSAAGLGQFVDRTWQTLLSKHRPDLVQGKTTQEILALKSDPELSKAMIQAYSTENSRILEQAGLQTTPGNVYLAHFAGPNGAVNILKADPATPVQQVLGEQVMKSNPFLAGKSVADLQQWASNKMGPAAEPNAPTSPPISGPTSPASMIPPGVMAQAPTAQPQTPAAPEVPPQAVGMFGLPTGQPEVQPAAKEKSFWDTMPAQAQPQNVIASLLEFMQSQQQQPAQFKMPQMNPMRGRGFY